MKIFYMLTMAEHFSAAFYMAQPERSQISLQTSGINHKIWGGPFPGGNAGASLKQSCGYVP